MRTAASALQAVLFDLDGLLVDSEPLWFEAEGAVAARLGGSPWTGGDQQALLGGTLERTVRYLLDRGSVDADPAEVARWLVDSMAGLITDRGLALLPGAGELHAELATAGIPVALVSSSKPEVVTAALDATGLRFDVVSRIRTHTCRLPPHSQPTRRAAWRWRIRPRAWRQPGRLAAPWCTCRDPARPGTQLVAVTWSFPR